VAWKRSPGPGRAPACLWRKAGALLQIVNRDEQRFAMKCSAVQVNGQWRDVFKDPATDPDKRSKAGRLTLLHRGDAFATVRLDSLAQAEHLDAGWHEALRTVYEDGRLLIEDTLAQVRQRAS
jgi:nicotinamide phosphoribosyltransferase